MPLSERERQLLEQMEQALSAEDPRLASQMRQGTDNRRRNRQFILGGAVVVIGLAVVLLGVMQQSVWIGAVGFLVMVAGAIYALRNPHHPHLGVVQPDGTQTPAAPSGRAGRGSRSAQSLKRPKRPAPRSGTFMQRLEMRWDRRRERGEF